MKKSKLLASVAIAGMVVGAQVAKADHHKGHKKGEKNSCESKEKNSCKGKEKNSCEGKEKNSCTGKKEEGKKEGKSACSGPHGCDGKMEEHPAAPSKPAEEKKQ